MSEHPIDREIESLQIDTVIGDGYNVGERGVTKIEACTKSGMHADIPYLRVWVGDKCIAELCQHNIVKVVFKF